MRAPVRRIGATLTRWLSQQWPWLLWLLLALVLAVTVLWPLPALLTRLLELSVPGRRLMSTRISRLSTSASPACDVAHHLRIGRCLLFGLRHPALIGLAMLMSKRVI